ncbi:MAG: LytR C-terminal domain-containing protein [Endomicrobiaceae bacterium]|nr:LytR C-terminal domain-containing protein [Endomicrobiaceae bacterium]
MFKKIILVFFVCLIIASSVLYYLSDIYEYIGLHKTINVLVVIEGSQETYPNTLKILLCQYIPKTKRIQFLFINENIAILKRKSKTRTLKELFYTEKENNRIDFIQKEIAKLFNNALNIDYYIYLNTDTLNSFLKLFNKTEVNKLFGDNFLKNILNNSNYLNNIVINIKVIKYVIVNFNRRMIIDIIKFLKNNNIVMSTNFKWIDCIPINHIIKNINIKDITFVDIPTVIRRNRIEIDDISFDRVIEILNNDFTEDNRYKINLKVLNASNKNRLAEKAVNMLRQNLFDVFYWGNESQKNDFTIILDRINNHEKSSQIVDILGCGEVLVVPNPKPFVDMTVLIGNDCNLYDKLDKIQKK